MGLRNIARSSSARWRTVFACAAILGVLTGCTARSVVTPADRVKGETFRFDCCDPGLGEADKWMCDQAIKNPDHVFVDTDGNRYEFVWSDCKIGEEPWRKYE